MIQKLRKINQLFDAQRKLTKEKETLNNLKMCLLNQQRQNNNGNDSFKDKSSQCRKVTQRLKLCSKLHKSGQQSEARNIAMPALDELKQHMQWVDL